MPPVKINGQIVELSSCLLLLSVVGLCVLSVSSRRQEAGWCLVIKSERIRERGTAGNRGAKTKRKGGLGGREGEKKRGGREIESYGRWRYITMSDTQTHCSHRFIIAAASAGTTGHRKRLNWRKGARTEEGRQGTKGKTNVVTQLDKSSAAKENHVRQNTHTSTLLLIDNVVEYKTAPIIPSCSCISTFSWKTPGLLKGLF